MDNIYLLAAAWMAIALAASLVSIRLEVSVALIEIGFGILAGNFAGLHTSPWIDFLATFGSGLLTFLAGAEIDPQSLRRHIPGGYLSGVIARMAGKRFEAASATAATAIEIHQAKGL
jgi:Kef-type K+ transport system membrane component KefB